MWACSKCGEEVDDDFELCWSCGTTREGVETGQFNPETEGILGDDAYRAERVAVQYEDLVTVATFGNAPEAHMARSRLESAGIAAFLTDELAGTALGMLPGLTGVRLQVAEKDAIRARLLLAEVPHLRPEEPAAEEGDREEYDDDYDEDDAEDSEEGIKE